MMSKNFYRCILGLIVGGVSFLSSAAVSLDRTRAIYPSNEKVVTININNDNKKYPFLAQVWIEDEHGRKVTSPMLALPPLQRINAGQKAVVNITTVPGAEALPTDRESIFYFNLREIPPKSDKKNVMQITLQSKIKLFYRPEAIVREKGNIWQNELIVRKSNNKIIIDNPTPFYITVSQLLTESKKKGGKIIKGFEPMMIAPKSTVNVNAAINSMNNFVLTYINDYGGYIDLLFSCNNGTVCRVINK